MSIETNYAAENDILAAYHNDQKLGKEKLVKCYCEHEYRWYFHQHKQKELWLKVKSFEIICEKNTSG